jgi:hypothetical protein
MHRCDVCTGVDVLALEVRDRCLLLLLVFKRVLCTDY